MSHVRYASLLAVAAAFSAAVVTPRGHEHEPPQQPQPQQQQPVFRAGANFVHVDVYPRQEGRLVDDLTRDDFQVFEDGQPQAIETFELVRVPPYTPEAERRDPGSVEEANRLAADPRRRVFVVYLNHHFFSMDGARQMRTPLMTFLRRAIGPDDLFGVLIPGLSAAGLTFGRRMEVVEQAVEAFWKRLPVRRAEGREEPQPETQHELFLYHCYIARWNDPDANRALVNRLIGLSRMDDLFTNLRDTVRHLATIREARTNVIFVSGRFIPRGSDQSLARALWGAGPPQIGVDPSGRLTTSAQPYTIDPHACDQELTRLGMLENDDRLREVVDEARRANVAFYPVNPEGLEGGASLESMDALYALALDSGGRVVANTNDIETPLRRIADDLSAYYLLGYYSTNRSLDGRYRRIEVKVARKGLDVAARRGYQPPSEADRRAAESASPVVTRPPAHDAVLGRLDRVRRDADLLTHAAAGPGAVRVAAELGRRIVATAPWIDGAPVDVTLTTADGAVVGRGAGRIEPGTRGAVVDVPVPAEGTGPWRAAVVVGEGRARLQDTVPVEPAPDAAIGDTIAFRATPSPRSPLIAVADFHYRRTERVHLEWLIDASVAGGGGRLLGKDGQALPVPVRVGILDTTGPRRLAADVNLAPLTEGDYLIEVTIGGATRVTAIRVDR